MAQLAKHPTLDFSSGDDFMLCELEPRVSLCTDSIGFSLSFLSAPPLLVSALSLSLKISKQMYIFKSVCL